MKCKSCGYEMIELADGSYECHMAWCSERKRTAIETIKECVYCGNQFAFSSQEKKDSDVYEDYVCLSCSVKCKSCGHPKGEHYTDEYDVKYCGVTISNCDCKDFEPTKKEVI